MKMSIKKNIIALLAGAAFFSTQFTYASVANEVIYTLLNNDNPHMTFDVNRDGVDDIRLDFRYTYKKTRTYQSCENCYTDTTVTSTDFKAVGLNSTLVTADRYYRAGDVIDENLSYTTVNKLIDFDSYHRITNVNGSVTTYYAPREAGTWGWSSAGYLGFSIPVNGGYHYGWVRVSASTNSAALVHVIGHETYINTAIVSGAEGPSAENNNAPIAVAGASMDLNNNIQLDATLSSDPDGDSLSYSWEIAGDPALRYGEVALVNDLEPGSYVVTLTVSDAFTRSVVQTKLAIPEPECDPAELDAAFNSGYSDGYQTGETTGYNNGYNDGYQSGETTGYNNGYNVGYQSGETAGYTTGYSTGFSEGQTDGITSCQVDPASCNITQLPGNGTGPGNGAGSNNPSNGSQPPGQAKK